MVTVKESDSGNYKYLEVEGCNYALTVWNPSYFLTKKTKKFGIDIVDDRGDYSINMSYDDIDAMIAMLYRAKKILISQEL